MSVGHVAREVESAGIPTAAVYVQSFRHVATLMGVPRVVSPRHPMGRPLGGPGDWKRHQEVLEAALSLLETADCGGALVELDAPYRPGRCTP